MNSKICDEEYQDHSMARSVERPSASSELSSTVAVTAHMASMTTNDERGIEGYASLKSSSSHVLKYQSYFIQFTRVLMKYLEKKDGDLLIKAKEIQCNCMFMQTQLRELVGDFHWKRATVFFEKSLIKHFMKNDTQLSYVDASKMAKKVARIVVEVSPARKTRKRRFYSFIQALLKNLKSTDQAMFSQVKEHIEKCVNVNRQRDASTYTHSSGMLRHLRNLVGDIHWKEAENRSGLLCPNSTVIPSKPTTL